jgi:hypothetical protein
MGLAEPVVGLGWTGSGPQARPKRKGIGFDLLFSEFIFNAKTIPDKSRKLF